MKDNICPKCESTDILHIRSKFHNLRLTALPIDSFRFVSLTWYICGACGYAEQWVDSAMDLERLRRKYSKRERPVEDDR